MRGLATNGPWALVSGWLIWEILKAWGSDRAQLATVLTEMRTALAGLQTAVDRLREELESPRGAGTGETT